MIPLTPLTTAARAAKRADYVQEIVAANGDLAAGLTNTALGLSTFKILANVNGLELSHVELIEPFQDTADAANASTALTIGDAGSATRHLASMELNANGSYVPLKFGTGTKYVPTTDTTTVLTFTPTSGKNVANLNKGRLMAYWKLINATDAIPLS